MATVSGKIFAVTGGASGIGAATCRLLARRGAGVLCIGDISDKGFNDLEQTIKEINPATKVQCTILDVTSSAEVDRWIQGVITTFGELHGAANVAGISQGAGLRQTPTLLGETDEDWRDVFRVNLDGIFYCSRAQVRAMKGLPVCDRTIVNVASIAALWHVPDVFAYGTSKCASSYFTACAAADVHSLGIRVNSVCPGITETPLLPKFMPGQKTVEDVKNSYREEGFDILQPEDIARTIVWLLSEDSRPVYGANINVGAAAP
ncbi:short chain dehydrogenase/oxidoreductase CpoX2 [Aspergillus unguis]